MGFGHPVYRTDDPPSVTLRQIALGLGGDAGDFAISVERIITETLAKLHPDHLLYADVECYAGSSWPPAAFLEICSHPRSPSARVIGWCANIAEHAESRGIIRPYARYTGPPPPDPVPTQS